MVKKYETTLPATEARKKFFKILEEIKKPDQVYTITLDGKKKAVILSAEEYESWLETMEIIQNPKVMKEIKEAEKEFKRGEYATLEEVLKEEGFILADKSKKRYEVSSRSKKKGSKKSKKNR
jgi:prevent-host-death family protein